VGFQEARRVNSEVVRRTLTWLVQWLAWLLVCSADRCLLSADGGDNSCSQSSERLSWYYDSSTAACVQFIYAGCAGNDNRFETELDCRAACVGVYDSVARGLGKTDADLLHNKHC